MSLLAIEWLKIKRYRTFWVICGLFAVLLPGFNYLITHSVLRIGPQGGNLLNQGYSFPEVWGTVGWWGSVFVMFLAIGVITITSNEYSFRTHRQNVIDGWSRLSFFHAKAQLVLAMSVATSLYFVVVALMFGLGISGSASGIGSGLEPVGYFFLLTLNYLSAALFLALLIRKSGLAIALFMVYCMIIEVALSAIINFMTHTKWGNFLPLQTSDELLPSPLVRTGGALLGLTQTVPDYAYVAGTLVWITVYYFAGRALVLKRDM